MNGARLHHAALDLIAQARATVPEDERARRSLSFYEPARRAGACTRQTKKIQSGGTPPEVTQLAEQFPSVKLKRLGEQLVSANAGAE